MGFIVVFLSGVFQKTQVVFLVRFFLQQPWSMWPLTWGRG